MADIGTILGGRYRLIELLGQGGMATIYRAHDQQLERDVAVKVLRPEYGRDPDFFARFRQEAQSAAALNHPGVVAVYDYGTDPAGPFIVMELVDGEDLAPILRRSGALPPRQAARLVSQTARAIAAAHASGFVHRDIKPGNILVNHEGQVKVTDFGIARAVAEAAVTLPGTTLGSVHYFSPEQARGEMATTASDIYSMGIVLYELLTGRRPWEGDSAAAVATARLTGPVPSPSNVRAGVPPVLEAITRKALATNAPDRFASAAAMADALDRYLADSAPAASAASGLAGGALKGGVAGAAAVLAAEAAAGAAAAGVAGAPGAAAASAGVAGAAGAGAAGVAGASSPLAGDPTLVGTAQQNPGARIPYAPDAFAGTDSGRPRQVGAGRRVPDEVRPDDDDGGDDDGRGTRTVPWLWISGALAIVILALAGFLLFRLLSNPSTPPPQQAVVPNLVGMTYDVAKATAEKNGLTVSRAAFEASSQPDGTVLRQNPAAGGKAYSGTTIELTLALGNQTVPVPDLRGKTESEAVNLIAAAKLTIGNRTDAFDASIPAGKVVSQDPGPGLVVTQGLTVNYVISKGPEPTPTPSPSPSPSPTPSPSPSPTPAPTAAPTPGPQIVGNYVCLTFGAAKTAIAQKGFSLRNVTPQPTPSPTGPVPDTWIVTAQLPVPLTLSPYGTAIDLTVQAPPGPTCPA